MTKDEMVEVLKANGYPAENENGVVYIRKALTEKEVKDVIGLMRREKYRESYGYRVKRS